MIVAELRPRDVAPWGTQPRRLYDVLAECGEVSNVQIVRDLHILAYAGVIAKVRKAIQPHGLDIAKRRYSAGVWTYRLAIKERMVA